MFLLFLFLCPVFTNQTYTDEIAQVWFALIQKSYLFKEEKIIIKLNLMSLNIKQFTLITHLFKIHYL